MKDGIHIPHEWFKYHNAPAYFITYFGEIYFGTIWELHEYPDRFFIVQNDKIHTIRDLKQEERTLEKYQQIGREIRDVNVIKQIIDYEFGKHIPFKNLSFTSEQDFKRMFVFGAAASTFCIFGEAGKKFRELSLNPPTGYEIFDAKYDSFITKYPAAKISTPLFESKDKDIEQCLEEEWQAYKTFYSPQVANRHINLQYYIQELFSAISKEVTENHFRNNLYSLFLNKLQKHIAANPKERIALVSFNYDTIIDGFASQIFQNPFSTMGDYIDWDKRNILLFKPHGSCNWGWKFKSDKLNGNTQATIPEALYQQKIEPWQVYFHLLGELNEVVAQNSWGHEWGNDKHYRGRFTINKNLLEIIPDNSKQVYFPALLLPYRDKDEMVMPYDHFNAMEHCMRNMEELYLIGWKGNEDLFNRLLERHKGRLTKIVIVNPQPEIVKCNLKKHFDISKIKNVEVIKDFENFVLNKFAEHLA
ncbi:MAG: hypothetical protein AABZ32_06970 [Bacteroidota bacterium]